MKKTLYTINTVNNFMDIIFKPFGEPFAAQTEGLTIYNIMDDSLLKETLAGGGVTANVCSRMLSYAQAAQASGADGILTTCTSVNEATKYIRKFLNIPVMNIEEPVAEMAVANGTRIGILATLPTSPAAIGRVIMEKAAEAGKEIELVNEVVDGAFDVLCSGDREKHDRMVCEALYQLAEKVDVIAFAQISMSLLPHDPVNVPVYKIGFGQTKIKANRARINSSSALQFVDRSIVNSEFNLDRDFGFFGEYNMRGGEGFNLSAKGSVTLGEGRNWGSSSNGGLAYTGRLELYPLGRFKSKGDVMEGDFEGEEQVKILVAGAYSYNHKASRLKGQRGAVMPDDATRNIGSYFADFILKYRGFAFYTDFMGRSCDRPLFDPQSNAFVYSGQGLNIQTSYLFDKKWEVALRNSTLFPEHEVQPFAGYKRWNQTTVGITRYIIGHSLKVQADMSYNHRSESFDPDYNRWEIRFQLELGL